jgi:hypothetical protein
MKRFPRAVLHTLSGQDEEALAEWRAIRAETPPGPDFDAVRKLADDWILVRERDLAALTPEEEQALGPAVRRFVHQQRALKAADSALEAGWGPCSEGTGPSTPGAWPRPSGPWSGPGPRTPGWGRS